MTHYTYDEQMFHYMNRIHTGKALTPQERADLSFLYIENHMRQMKRHAQREYYGTNTEQQLGTPDLPND